MKSTHCFRHLCVIMVALLLVALSGPLAGDAGKEAIAAPKMKLRFACPIPEVSVISKFQKFFLTEVTKRTAGRITFEEFWGGSLVRPWMR